MNLGGRLKFARESRELTQDDLAKKAGDHSPGFPISQAMISALETRDSETTVALFAFARALNVSPEWLQTGYGSSGLEPSAPALIPKGARNKSERKDEKVKRRTS